MANSQQIEQLNLPSSSPQQQQLQLQQQQQRQDERLYGLGKTGGIPNGVIYDVTVGTVGGNVGTLIAGGIFEFNYAHNIAQLGAGEGGCDDFLCTNLEWERVLPWEWSFSNTSVVTCLSISPDNNTLFIGGDFEITYTGGEKGEGEKGEEEKIGEIIRNFAIFHLDTQTFEWEASGLENGIGREGDTEGGGGEGGQSPTVECFRIVNDELWIGGTFSAQKGEWCYTSLARMDISTYVCIFFFVYLFRFMSRYKSLSLAVYLSFYSIFLSFFIFLFFPHHYHHPLFRHGFLFWGYYER